MKGGVLNRWLNFGMVVGFAVIALFILGFIALDLIWGLDFVEHYNQSEQTYDMKRHGLHGPNGLMSTSIDMEGEEWEASTLQSQVHIERFKAHHKATHDGREEALSFKQQVGIIRNRITTNTFYRIITNALETQMHVNAILPSTLFILTEIVHTFKTSYGIETYKSYLSKLKSKHGESHLSKPLRRPKTLTTVVVVLLLVGYTAIVCYLPLTTMLPITILYLVWMLGVLLTLSTLLCCRSCSKSKDALDKFDGLSSDGSSPRSSKDSKSPRSVVGTPMSAREHVDDKKQMEPEAEPKVEETH